MCRLAITLQNAVVQADSRGDHRQAARILDSALARPDAGDDSATLLEALVYRAEVALTLEDPSPPPNCSVAPDESSSPPENRHA